MKRVGTRISQHILLALPFLYRLVQYESRLGKGGGLIDLREQIRATALLPGDMIECGSAKCGTAIIAALQMRRIGANRRVLACDSFEGFDRVELARERRAGLTDAADDAFTSTSLRYVTRKIARLGLAREVVPVPGYFAETLPRIPGPFCLALIDCDLSESVSFCADTVWPRMVSAGVVLFDDYGSVTYRGVTHAVDRFVASRSSEIGARGMMRRLYFVTKK